MAPDRELDDILDAISYELTTARAAGLSQPEKVRSALRRARDLVADADALVAGHIVKRSEEE